MSTTHQAPSAGTSDDDMRSTCEREATQLIQRVNLRLKRLHDMGAHPGAAHAPAAELPVEDTTATDLETDPVSRRHPADPD